MTEFTTTDVDASRIDFWAHDLAVALRSSDPAEHVEARGEIQDRLAAAYDAFPSTDAYGADVNDPGALEAQEWEYASMTETATGKRADESISGMLRLIEMTSRVISWHENTGTPYAPPQGVGTTRQPESLIAGHAAAVIVDAADAERALHDLGGHAETPSHYCPECTPDPAMAYWALESVRGVECQEIAHRARFAVAQIERRTIEDRGLIDLDELVQRADDQPPPILGLIPTKGVTYLAGGKSTLKTFIMLYIAIQIALTGRRAMFLAGEGVDSFGHRLRAGAEHYGTTVSRLKGTLRVVEAMPDFYARDEAFEDVLARARRERPALIVVDHLAIVSGAAAQEQGGPMAKVSRSAHMLAEASGGAVVVIAHHGKNAGRGIRGHSVVEDMADCVLTTLRTGDSPRVTVRVDKNRDGATGQWQRFETQKVAGSLALDPVATGDGSPDPVEQAVELDDASDDDEAVPITDRLLIALKDCDGPAARSDLIDALVETGPAVPTRTFNRHMVDLVTEGIVVKTGDRKTTRYALAKASE